MPAQGKSEWSASEWEAAYKAMEAEARALREKDQARSLQVKPVCPASIWLLGAPVNCIHPAGHDSDPASMHEVRIMWKTGA
jgi:hypothetical protein